MSLDLLNEFGSSGNASINWETHSVAPNAHIPDDDDFGDFEEPEDRLGPSKLPNTSVSNLKPKQRVSPYLSQSKQFPVSDPDHDIPADEDGWGDFEGNSVFFDADQIVAQGTNPSNKPQTSSDQAQIQKSPKVRLLPIDQRDPIVRPSNHVPEQHDDQYDYSQDESWEPTDFSHAPIIPATAATSQPAKPATQLGHTKSLKAEENIRGPPPSNIPPPSILLPLIARSFLSFPTDIKDIATAQSGSLSEVLSQQQLHRINIVFAIARAGAHVLAGRRLRWKRDNILSQSMKIGPAGGKLSGMKLTGVDKTESRREDQEAAEVLSAWRKQLGPLRSAISVVKDQHSGRALILPDISETMPIRVLKPSEGAVSAPKACFLCGIKRDERIVKIDVDVEDSFGEWWCEHWGHVDCVTFWDSCKDTLPQR